MGGSKLPGKLFISRTGNGNRPTVGWSHWKYLIYTKNYRKNWKNKISHAVISGVLLIGTLLWVMILSGGHLTFRASVARCFVLFVCVKIVCCFCILLSGYFATYNVDGINCVEASLYRTYCGRWDHSGIVVEDDVKLLHAGLDVVVRRDTWHRRAVLDETEAQVGAVLRVDETLEAAQGGIQQPGDAEQAHHNLWTDVCATPSCMSAAHSGKCSCFRFPLPWLNGWRTIKRTIMYLLKAEFLLLSCSPLTAKLMAELELMETFQNKI